MKDLSGKTIRVGDTIVYAGHSFTGYLGQGEVVEIIPAIKNAKGVITKPDMLKVRVGLSSKYAGAKKGTVITLGRAPQRVEEPLGRVQTILVWPAAGVDPTPCSPKPKSSKK